MVFALACASLAGCGVYSSGCASWAAFDTPAEAADAADAVVIGHVVARDGVGEVGGAEAHAWTVSVQRWMKGSGGDRIRVLATPAGCADGSPEYPGGDRFEPAVADHLSVVFLSEYASTSTSVPDGADAVWVGLSPFQAVIPATPAGGIPKAWPAEMVGGPVPTP